MESDGSQYVTQLIEFSFKVSRKEDDKFDPKLFRKELPFDNNEIQFAWIIWYVGETEKDWTVKDSYGNEIQEIYDMTLQISIFVVRRQKYIDRNSMKSLDTDVTGMYRQLLYSMINGIMCINSDGSDRIVRGDFSSFKHDDYYLSHDIFFKHRDTFDPEDGQLYLHVIDVKAMYPKYVIDFTAIIDQAENRAPPNPMDMKRWNSIADVDQSQKIMLIARVDKRFDIDKGVFTVFAEDTPHRTVTYRHIIQDHDGKSLELDFISHDCAMIIGLDKPFVYTPEIGKIKLDELPKFDDIMMLISSFDATTHPSLRWIEYVMRKDINTRLNATIDMRMEYVGSKGHHIFTWRDIDHSFDSINIRRRALIEKLRDRVVIDLSKLSLKKLEALDLALE